MFFSAVCSSTCIIYVFDNLWLFFVFNDCRFVILLVSKFFSDFLFPVAVDVCNGGS